MISPGFPKNHAGNLLAGDGCAVWPPLDRIGEPSSWRLGHSEFGSGAGLAGQTEELYEGIFKTQPPGWELCRLWHFVPKINETTTPGRDRYMDFCVGREAGFAHSPRPFVGWPSASAVGASQPPGLLAYVMTTGRIRLIENPLQTPAWRYPERYGPSPPVFSRACEVTTPGESVLFISGTASVRASETVHPGNTLEQMRVTEENLREVSLAAGWGREFGGEAVLWRHWRVYVRDRNSLLAAQEWMGRVAGAGDVAVFLHADICRSDLMLEVDLTVCR